MQNLILKPSPTALWHALVQEAAQAVDCRLDEEQESYLVFLLMRYVNRPEMASSVLALDYLEGMHIYGYARHDALRDVGDKCLLYSGLFPQRATRRRVRISYYVDLGRSAYCLLADQVTSATAELYTGLAQGFVSLMDVLQTMRGDSPAAELTPILAYELWEDTRSAVAGRRLRRGGSHPVPAGPADHS